VQLGAFQNFNNAQTFLAHVQTQLASAQVEPRVREANGMFRVYVGPYQDRDEAKRVAGASPMRSGSRPPSRRIEISAELRAGRWSTRLA
jgi:cell division septation protein DedD